MLCSLVSALKVSHALFPTGNVEYCVCEFLASFFNFSLGYGHCWKKPDHIALRAVYEQLPIKAGLYNCGTASMESSIPIIIPRILMSLTQSHLLFQRIKLTMKKSLQTFST
jgi:hypothetical protein